MQQVCLSSLLSQRRMPFLRFAISNSVSLKLSFILRWSCLIIRKEHTLSPEWLGGRSKGSWRFNPNKLGRKSGQNLSLLRGQTYSPKIVQIPTNLHLQQQLCKLPISSVQCPVSSVHLFVSLHNLGWSWINQFYCVFFCLQNSKIPIFFVCWSFWYSLVLVLFVFVCTHTLDLLLFSS